MKRAYWYREKPKSWSVREVEADGSENGSAFIADTSKGFEWEASTWIADKQGKATQRADTGKETTYRQARDRVLTFFRIEPRNIDYFLIKGTQNPKRATAAEIEPKPPKPRLTFIKKTSNAARARAAKKIAKTALARIRAFVMPSKKKGKRRR